MKFCSKCGKELLDEAVICPGCGCPVDSGRPMPQDYKTVLHSTKIMFIVGLVLLGLGIFAWVANETLSVIYAVIGEGIESILGARPTMRMYNTCDILANWSSVVFLFAAEFLFVLPKTRFNTAFKSENRDLLIKNKAEYKRAAREKNREMNKEISFYRICWIMAIVSFALFVVSIVFPGLGL